MYLPTFAEIMQVAQSRGADSDAPGLWRGLVGAWPLQETGGLTAFDASGYGNLGTLTSMDPATDRVVTAKGRALDFDGTDDYVLCGNSSSLNPTGAMSIAAWINATTAAQAEWAVGRDEVAGGRSYAFGKGSNTKLVLQIKGGSTCLGSTALVGQTWYHIACRGSPAIGWEIYLNGRLDATPAAWVAPNVSTTETDIGRRSYGGIYFGWWFGRISNVLIANRAWSPVEIFRLYADPWAMYRLRPRMVFPGWTPADGFKAAWVRRSSQIIGGGVA